VQTSGPGVNDSIDSAGKQRYDCPGMFAYLFFLFTVVSLLELALLVWIGGQSAWWVPILLVIVTGLAGAGLARWQGWQLFHRLQDDLRQGHVPADALLDGLFLFAAGLLLVTPGVLTDMAGFALLLPPIRGALKRRAGQWLRQKAEIHAARFSAKHGADVWNSPSTSAQNGHVEIIDARVIDTRVENAE
jgi:UPF0716 protein FxsA